MLSLRSGVVVLVLAFVAGMSLRANAQSISKVEAAIGYSYVHTKAPPGDCGCFSMNGGTGSAAYYFRNHFGAVTEVSGQTAANIGTAQQDLTLVSYLFGPRYRWHPAGKLVPFGQVLVGAAHAGNSLAPGTDGNSGSANVFARPSSTTISPVFTTAPMIIRTTLATAAELSSGSVRDRPQVLRLHYWIAGTR